MLMTNWHRCYGVTG